MAEGMLWTILAVLRAGANLDEPAGVPVRGRDLLPTVSMESHRRTWIRVGPVQLPQSLVPPSVALETERRPVSLRVGRYLGGHRG